MLAPSVSWLPTWLYSVPTKRTIRPVTELKACFYYPLDLELMKSWHCPKETLRWVPLNVHPKEAHLQMVQGNRIFWFPALSRLFSLFQALLSLSSIWSHFFHPLRPFPSCFWVIHWVTDVSWLLIPLQNAVVMSKQQWQLVFSIPVGLGLLEFRGTQRLYKNPGFIATIACVCFVSS